jgi:hypothetical protein
MVSASLSFLCVWRVSRVRGGQYGNACVSCMYPVFILMDTGPSPYGANQRAPKRAATRTTPGNLSSRIARCPVSRVLVGQYSSTESRGQPDLHLETRNENGGRCPEESTQRPCRVALRPRRLLGACEYTPPLSPSTVEGTHAHVIAQREREREREREIQIEREREKDSKRERERETNQTP